ncbi:hypothetical protein DF186_15060, partial [Enterococcus hirae]
PSPAAAGSARPSPAVAAPARSRLPGLQVHVARQVHVHDVALPALHPRLDQPAAGVEVDGQHRQVLEQLRLGLPQQVHAAPGIGLGRGAFQQV